MAEAAAGAGPRSAAAQQPEEQAAAAQQPVEQEAAAQAAAAQQPEEQARRRGQEPAAAGGRWRLGGGDPPRLAGGQGSPPQNWQRGALGDDGVAVGAATHGLLVVRVDDAAPLAIDLDDHPRQVGDVQPRALRDQLPQRLGHQRQAGHLLGEGFGPPTAGEAAAAAPLLDALDLGVAEDLPDAHRPPSAVRPRP
ncbi:MAG: hypothetical protein R2726_17520 [Acidimicrobiales bacterium]